MPLSSEAAILMRTATSGLLALAIQMAGATVPGNTNRKGQTFSTPFVICTFLLLEQSRLGRHAHLAGQEAALRPVQWSCVIIASVWFQVVCKIKEVKE